MKKLFLLSCISIGAVFIACNTDKAAKEKQDSIAAAATADSMLQGAIAADTLGGDTLKADTVNQE